MAWLRTRRWLDEAGGELTTWIRVRLEREEACACFVTCLEQDPHGMFAKGLDVWVAARDVSLTDPAGELLSVDGILSDGLEGTAD